jgi:hypothetical protein
MSGSGTLLQAADESENEDQIRVHVHDYCTIPVRLREGQDHTAASARTRIGRDTAARSLECPRCAGASHCGYGRGKEGGRLPIGGELQ